jgi:hypothetical protein
MKRLALIVLLLCTPALAHDASRPELNSWFDHLASGKGLCCSFADGMALADVDWESHEGHYRIRLDNEWIDVRDDAVITEPNRAGDSRFIQIRVPAGTMPYRPPAWSGSISRRKAHHRVFGEELAANVSFGSISTF